MSGTGLTLAFLTVFAGALGLNTEVNLAHLVFSLGIGLLATDAIAVAITRRRAPALSATRHLPSFVTLGQTAQYRMLVRNDGAVAAARCVLVEVMHQPWFNGASTVSSRHLSYPVFLRLLRRWRVLEPQRQDLPALAISQIVKVTLRANPTARGLATFESLCAVITGPLGLVESRLAVAVAPTTLMVLPQRIAVELPPPQGQRILQAGGISLANQVGDSQEFRSLRDYRAGDPMRSIHWRSFARTGKPVVREYQQEYFTRHTLVLDTACGPSRQEAFEASVSIAAWLVARPLDADSLLDLMFVGERVHRVTMGRSLGNADSLLRVLATVMPTPPDSVTQLLATLARNAAELSSLVVIFQDWDAPRQAVIAKLMAHGLRPIVLLVEPDDAPVAPPIEAKWTGTLHRLPLSTLNTLGRLS